MEVAYNEYKMLKNLDHPGIVKMHDAFLNKMCQTMYLVMDLVPGQTLTDLMEVSKKSLSVNDQKHIFKQLIDILNYLK
jgi:serine/threonine protein kinase